MKEIYESLSEDVIQLENEVNDLKKTNEHLNKKLKKINKKNKEIVHSRSYIIGRKITGIYRKSKGKINEYNENKSLKLPPKKGLRVLFMPSDNDRTSGAFLSMVNLVANLRDKFGVEAYVILPNEGDGEELLDDFNVNYHMVESKDWVIRLSTKKDSKFKEEVSKKRKINEEAIKKISKFIKINKFDILHINTTYSYVGAKAALNQKIPFVWHLREFLEEDQSKTLWDREKGNRLINKANNIIAISDSIFNKYKNTFDDNRLVRIYNGIDANKFYKPNKELFAADKIRFIMVGSFGLYKGQKEFAEACLKLYNSGVRDFEVIFIGRGSQDFQNEVQNILFPLRHNVEFLGYKKDVENYYESADISFTCSQSEAFGRTTVEAMLSGNLVIGADTGGTIELIDDGKTGILYKQGDSNDLYEKMAYAVNHKEDMKIIADNGRNFMFKNMTAEKNAENIFNLYNNILNNN